MRTHTIFNVDGSQEIIPFSAEEEAEWDARDGAIAASGEEVDAERERRIAMPLTVALAGGTKVFRINMDEKSQRNIQGLATVGINMALGGITTTVAFRDYDNVMQDLTAEDLRNMGLQAAARIQTVYAKSWALKAMTPIPGDYTDDVYW